MAKEISTGLVLITRPEPDATLFAAQVKAAGRDVLVAPMIDIAFETSVELPGRLAALAFTSANGVRALAEVSNDRPVPVFAVGPTTASLARSKGFDVAGVADSSVESLTDLIASRYHEPRFRGRRICHITGSHQAGNLIAALKERRVQAEALKLYDARAATRLSDQVIYALGEGQVSDIVFFSPRTSEIFRQLVEAAGLSRVLSAARFLCLSKAVAEPLSGLVSGGIIVAPHPNAAALIDIVAVEGT